MVTINTWLNVLFLGELYPSMSVALEACLPAHPNEVTEIKNDRPLENS